MTTFTDATEMNYPVPAPHDRFGDALALPAAMRSAKTIEAEDEQPRIVATFDSYAGMLDAIRARVNELQVSGERLDEYVGLPRGYYSKVAGAKPIRRLGMTSFAPILNGLGLKCQFIEDPVGTEHLKNRLAPRNSSYVRGAPSIVLTIRYFKKIGRKGAQARVENSTKEQRREWARKAAIARWRGP
jgi:hypothetical protein